MQRAKLEQKVHEARMEGQEYKKSIQMYKNQTKEAWKQNQLLRYALKKHMGLVMKEKGKTEDDIMEELQKEMGAEQSN